MYTLYNHQQHGVFRDVHFVQPPAARLLQGCTLCTATSSTAPLGMYTLYLANNTLHDHNTRGNTQLHITRTNHKFTQQCLSHNLPRVINATSEITLIKMFTHSINGFTGGAFISYCKTDFIIAIKYRCIMVCSVTTRWQRILRG